MKYHAAESFSGTSTYTRPTYHETRWPEWGLNFSYDGFGNLTSEVPVKGAAPTAYFSYEPATNRLTGSGYAYDANGNLTAAPLV